MIPKGGLQFGDVVWTRFDPSVGNEYKSKRPAVVIQSNLQLTKSNLVTVIPLTANLTNITNDDFIITADMTNGLISDSAAKVHHIVSFDYSRFDRKIGRINSTDLDRIREYLKIHFDIQ